jgi:hypothetical protein
MNKKVAGIGLALFLLLLCSPLSNAGWPTSGPPCSGYGCRGFESPKGNQPKSSQDQKSKRNSNAQLSVNQDSSTPSNASR